MPAAANQADGPLPCQPHTLQLYRLSHRAPGCLHLLLHKRAVLSQRLQYLSLTGANLA
jgi:hypothetical protein